MAVKKIKLFPCPHTEIRISVTEEMAEDFKECVTSAAKDGADGKDCRSCSWREMETSDGGCMISLIPNEMILGEGR